MYTAIKIIFLLIFSAFQIIMITNIFGDVKITHEIKFTSNEMSSSKKYGGNEENNVLIL